MPETQKPTPAEAPNFRSPLRPPATWADMWNTYFATHPSSPDPLKVLWEGKRDEDTKPVDPLSLSPAGFVAEYAERIRSIVPENILVVTTQALSGMDRDEMEAFWNLSWSTISKKATHGATLLERNLYPQLGLIKLDAGIPKTDSSEQNLPRSIKLYNGFFSNQQEIDAYQAAQKRTRRQRPGPKKL